MSTPVSTNRSEPAQVSLIDKAHFKLESLVSQKVFAEMRDGFRFAVAYALAVDANPPRQAGSRKTVFSTSTLDPDRYLKLAVECSARGEQSEPTYRVIERLADWGVIELARKIEEDFVEISDIVNEVTAEG